MTTGVAPRISRPTWASLLGITAAMSASAAELAARGCWPVGGRYESALQSMRELVDETLKVSDSLDAMDIQGAIRNLRVYEGGYAKLLFIVNFSERGSSGNISDQLRVVYEALSALIETGEIDSASVVEEFCGALAHVCERVHYDLNGKLVW